MKKKKIIFLLDHMETSNGVSRVLINLCNALDPEKFEITIRPLYRCDMNLKSELGENVRLKKVLGFYFKGLSKILKLIPTRFLYEKIVSGKYDIEVAFQCDMSTILIANSTNSKAVHVAWMHGYQAYPKEYLKYDKVVCVAQDNAERCKKEVDATVDVTYCHNIQDEKKIYKMAREEAECPQGKGALLVTVGRLSPEKGFTRLVNILHDLKEEGYEFRLMIIGAGNEEERIKGAIQAGNMEKDIYMLGKQYNPHKFTAQSDLFICSSFSESYHTASTEAAVLGIPIISTNVSGAREIISQCECGMITDIDDDSLKDGLRKILADQELLQSWKDVMSTTRKKFNFESGSKYANDLFNEFYELSDKRRR